MSRGRAERQGEREREREREREERIPIYTVCTEPNMGLDLTNHEIMT